jgi:putative RNA 2'-phosphotransferase
VDHIEISKFLSFVLRHKPDAIGLTLDREGWVDIGTLLASAAVSGRHFNRATLQAVVEGSDKKRFSISEDGLHIRAAQGHSTNTVSLDHGERVPPETLLHGTATRFLASIRAEGLRPGSRHHVHLSVDATTATTVGRRHGQPVVLRIDAQRMHEQGFRFFVSDNDVWLTERVPASFLHE